MKRVLLIAYYFPPIAASGSVRPAAFCRYLPELGWTPTIVTADGAALDPPLPEDRSLCDGLPADLDVVRVRHPNPNQFLLSVRDRVYALFRRRRSNAGPVGGGKASASAPRTSRRGIRRVLDEILDRVLIFPDPQKFWMAPALKVCEQIIQTRRPDVILATGGPWTGLLIGKTLSERHGIPLVADFRDPWATNPYLTYPSPRMQRSAEGMERGVCVTASAVIANTEELAESFRARYPQRAAHVVAITNGFDAALLRGDAGAGVPLKAKPLEIAHFGTVYAKRSPLPLFTALDRLTESHPNLREHLLVNFTGEWEIQDPVCNRLAEKLESSGVLQRHARIDRAECLVRMASSQVLLILQEGTPVQIPAKLYEYIAMRRPLVILGGVGATANLVRRHGIGVCCANETASIERLLRQLLEAPSILTLPSVSSVMTFEYRALTERLCGVLETAREMSKT